MSESLSPAESRRPLPDLAHELVNGLHQLQAMLCVIYGVGGESFRCYDAETQDAYVWGCADKAADCHRKAELVLDAWMRDARP
jgi:hypothetical protein